ncbi:unnamed protein product [Thlaspi arvense]|uniref:Factor of DNA methylation 1-5/IDN2 domain-containing protein n=1 Tax=Thlaspi arvense TaxID=13288 RepID=A0AAU9S4J0_THLAR|nr:unnamed protein product [Thlaspi arvense]
MTMEVIDEEDDKIKYLKQECGDEVYEAVTKALEELNEYNPNGQCPILELWNRNERRKAKLVEGIAQILKQWKQQQKRYRRRL